jgi:hypothetical protein
LIRAKIQILRFRMKSKVQYRYFNRNRNKFQLNPAIAKPRVQSPTESCFLCDEGLFVLQTKISGRGRIRVISHHEQCTVCKASVMSSRRRYMDHSVRAFSKVRVSLVKRGKPTYPKRKYRKCRFSTDQWINRCDRIDMGWPMGEIQAYYHR